MPYIARYQRDSLDDAIHELVQDISTVSSTPEDSVGVLNYTITKLLLDTMFPFVLGGPSGTMRYSKINAVIGILECAKQEFYRKAAAPYEDRKADINGDVYDD
jgi:hypothetical protein